MEQHLSQSVEKHPIGTLAESGLAVKKHVVGAEAKTWNPSNPASWDAEMREYHSLKNSDYMLPSDAKEQDRLEIQHHVFRASFQSDVICKAAQIILSTPGAKVLDVGCAKGFWLKSVKEDYPVAEYHGVDISESLVSSNRQENKDGLILTFGNVLERLPYDDNTFDYVHQRMLVLALPREKYVSALKELIRVTKPGGWIELLEGDIVFYNSGIYTRTLGTALFDALHTRGQDCYAATNLPVYASQVSESVENTDTEMVQIPLNWDSKVGTLFGHDAKLGLLGLEDWLTNAMGVSREEYRELLDNCYNEWAENKSFMQFRALYFQVKQ